jgi:hypothetical protein
MKPQKDDQRSVALGDNPENLAESVGACSPSPPAGPVLSTGLIVRVGVLSEVFAEVVPRPLEYWVSTLQDEKRPDSAVQDLEAVATVFQHICVRVELSLAEKVRLFKALVAVVEFDDGELKRQLPVRKGVPKMAALKRAFFAAATRGRRPQPPGSASLENTTLDVVKPVRRHFQLPQ